jgi:hypothetical protein
MIMERTGKTFVIVSNDGPNSQNVFVTWSREDESYTTTEWLDEVGELDFFDTIGAAMERTKEVYSSTFGGWNWAPMIVMEVLNFDDAFNNGEVPELKEIVSVTFKK